MKLGSLFRYKIRTYRLHKASICRCLGLLALALVVSLILMTSHDDGFNIKSTIPCRETLFVNCGATSRWDESRIDYFQRYEKFIKFDLDLNGPLRTGLRAFRRGDDENNATSDKEDMQMSRSFHNHEKIFRISYYNKPAWFKTYFEFKGCPFSNCESAGDATDSSVDMVVVQGETLDIKTPPPKRYPHQLYTMCGWEPPNYFYGTNLLKYKTQWNDVFNLTMTYRQDADVFMPFRTLALQGPNHVNMDVIINTIARKKRKTALALISNCKDGGSNRLAYINELKKYIGIDVFGQCGDPCPKYSGLCDRSNYITTADTAFEPYYFYLAFENSFCEDYLSEKFFKAYENNRPMITVARGGADYNKYFPTNTFINAADFKDARALGLYLKRLVRNPTEYYEIIRHKMMYRMVGMRDKSCMMCEFLNKRDPDVVRTYYDIKDWIGKCRKPPNDVSLGYDRW